ncbi:MAG: DMT family transporter [Carboxydocellales bacterium]
MHRNLRWTSKYFVLIIATIACVLWGTAFPLLKLSYLALEIKPDNIYLNMLFAAYRFFVAGLMLFGLLIIRRESLTLDKTSLIIPLFVLGLFQTSLQYFFFYVGLAHTTGVKASIIGATGTFFAVIIAHFFYRDDRISWYKVSGIVLGFTGIIVVNLAKGKLSLDFTWLGEGFLILAALTGTLGAILSKALSQKVSAVLATAYQMVIGSILLFVVAISHVSPSALNFNYYSAGLFLWLAFLSAAAFSLWYMLLKSNPLGTISIYQLLIPVFGAAFSAGLVPGEKLTPRVVLALALVSLGIIVVNYEKRHLTSGAVKQ